MLKPILKNLKLLLRVFNQPPDFGNEFNQPGNAANKAKGNAIAVEKPNMLIIGAILSPVVALLLKQNLLMGQYKKKKQ